MQLIQLQTAILNQAVTHLELVKESLMQPQSIVNQYNQSA